MHDGACQLERPVGQRFGERMEQPHHGNAQRIVAQSDHDHVNREGHPAVHNAGLVVDFRLVNRFWRPPPVAQLRDAVPDESAQGIGQQVIDIELPIRARVDTPKSTQLRQFDCQ